MIRKSLFFAVTVLVVGTAGYQLAWHAEVLGGAGDIGKSVGAIVVALVAIALAIWAILRPTKFKVGLSFVLGFIAARLGGSLWETIGFSQLGWLFGSLIGLGVLYVGTVVDQTNSQSPNGGLRQRIKDWL